MKDRFLKYNENVNRLVDDCEKYPYIYVGIDFDNTIYDYNSRGDTYPKIVDVLQFMSKHKQFVLCLWTAREGDHLSFAVEYCRKLNIKIQHINEAPLSNLVGTRKPMFNILLDDHAGLPSAYLTLITTLKILKEYDYRYQPGSSD